jgi:two-component system CheB/CheR fusion protein
MLTSFVPTIGIRTMPVCGAIGNCDIVNDIIQCAGGSALTGPYWVTGSEMGEISSLKNDGISAANGRSRCRLVLLEDNDSVRRATEMFLSLEGFETHTAATIAEAENLLVGMQPGDVFITDYHLDGKLTGLDVLQQLRAQQGRDVPAILLSGDLQSVMRAVKTSIPHCRFLGKPVNTKALLSAIAELSGY